MDIPFTDSYVLNNTRCMICGKMHNTNVLANSSMSPKVQIKSDDCYTIYKRLLGIYGAPFIAILNSY